jgi:phage shock protein C
MNLAPCTRVSPGKEVLMEATRCPYCAEDVRAEAIRCPHCRSRLGDAGGWYRDHPERRLAGVAVAVARAFGISVAAARVAFIALGFVHLAGPLLYLALWLIVPFTPGERSLAEEGLRRGQQLVARLMGDDHSTTVPGGPRA